MLFHNLRFIKISIKVLFKLFSNQELVLDFARQSIQAVQVIQAIQAIQAVQQKANNLIRHAWVVDKSYDSVNKLPKIVWGDIGCHPNCDA